MMWNEVCQDARDNCYKPHTLLYPQFPSDPQVLSPEDLPNDLHEVRYRDGPPRKHPAIRGELDVHVGLVLSNWKNQGRPLSVIMFWPEEGRCSQCGVAPLTLQVRSFLGFVVQGLLQFHPSFWDFHNVVLYINSY